MCVFLVTIVMFAQVLEATAALDHRVEEVENSQRASSLAAASAEQVSSDCQSRLHELRKQLETIAGGIWGRDVGMDGPVRAGKPVVELLDDVSRISRQACTEEMLESVKTLVSQVCNTYSCVFHVCF